MESGEQLFDFKEVHIAMQNPESVPSWLETGLSSEGARTLLSISGTRVGRTSFMETLFPVVELRPFSDLATEVAYAQMFVPPSGRCSCGEDLVLEGTPVRIDVFPQSTPNTADSAVQPGSFSCRATIESTLEVKASTALNLRLDDIADASSNIRTAALEGKTISFAIRKDVLSAVDDASLKDQGRKFKGLFVKREPDDASHYQGRLNVWVAREAEEAEMGNESSAMGWHERATRLLSRVWPFQMTSMRSMSDK